MMHPPLTREARLSILASLTQKFKRLKKEPMQVPFVEYNEAKMGNQMSPEMFKAQFQEIVKMLGEAVIPSGRTIAVYSTALEMNFTATNEGVAKPNWMPTHKHYKGGYYKLINGEATYERDLHPVVVYENVDRRVWVRPASEFFGFIDSTPRFERLSTQTAIEIGMMLADHGNQIKVEIKK